MLISNNGISKVWLKDGYIFKQQPKFLTDNEIYCLKIMYPSGYVPKAEQIDIELIKMEYIKNEIVTEPDLLWYHFPRVLKALGDVGIKHGDLTKYAVLIRSNKPYIIDFAESRLFGDPRPNKRPGSDGDWLRRTFKELCDLKG